MAKLAKFYPEVLGRARGDDATNENICALHSIQAPHAHPPGRAWLVIVWPMKHMGQSRLDKKSSRIVSFSSCRIK